MSHSRSFQARLFRKTMKTLLILLILSMIILLAWRINISSFIPKSMKGLTTNTILSNVYQSTNGAINPFTQDYQEFTYNDEAYGYFSVMKAIFIPEAHQLQIITRYNNSTLKAIKDDFSLSEIPNRDTRVFDISIVITTKNNKIPPKRILPSSEQSEKNSLYNYVKLVFDDITIDDLVEGVFVDFYYIGNLDYNESPLGAVCIYNADNEITPYTLTVSDKKNLTIGE